MWEALALSNLLIGLAANRRYAWQAVGALGMAEPSTADRARRAVLGMKRLGMGGDDRLHSALGCNHLAAWNAEVLLPLLEEDPARAPFLAEGALLRLRAGARCFRRYRAELGVQT